VLNCKTLKLKQIELNIYYCKQTFMIFCTLNQILNRIVLHVIMQKNHKLCSRLLAVLTRVQLKLCWIGPHPALRLLLDTFSTANARSLICYLVIDLVTFLLFSQRFKSGDFVFMQDSAPCSERRQLRVIFEKSEKTSGSTAAVTKQNGTNSAHFQLNTC